MGTRFALVSISGKWEDPQIFAAARNALDCGQEVHLFMAVYPLSLPQWMDNRNFWFHPLVISEKRLTIRRFLLYFGIWYQLAEYARRYGPFHEVRFYEWLLVPAMIFRRLAAPLAARGSKPVYGAGLNRQ